MLSQNPDDHRSYVRDVRERNRELVHELLGKNTHLQRLATSLESETLRLKEESLDQEKTIFSLREEVDRRKTETVRLEVELGEIEASNQEYSERFVAVEQQNCNLANLYVASYQLCGTVVRKEILDAIQEIIINLIGSEELAVFHRDDHGRLEPIASFGLSEDTLARILDGSTVLTEVVERASTFVYTSQEGWNTSNIDQLMTFCVPLSIEGRVFGAIAVYRLLPQKGVLEPVDHELLGILATHAATALYAAELHDRHGQTIGVVQ